MNMKPALFAAGLAAMAGQTLAQSASVQLVADQTSVNGGETVEIEVRVTFSDGGAPSGVFGTSGLFGFAGTLEATGSAANDTTAATVVIDPSLDFGTIQQTSSAPSLITAGAGTGLSGGLTGSPATVLAFDATLGADASGSVDVTFEGAVVLVVGDDLVTFSTAQGPNQSPLSVTGVTITVGGAARLCADQNGDGVASPGDFNAWILNFNAGD
ncbi:MAG: hypothetical protein AAFO89_13885, partial [Planctomycetota bacterium]